MDDLLSMVLRSLYPQQQSPQQPTMMLPGQTKTSTQTQALSSNPVLAMLQKQKIEEEAKKKSGTYIGGTKIF